MKRRHPTEDGLEAQFEHEPVSITGIKPGQRYWAARNCESVILTCKEDNRQNNCVFPIEFPAYVYDRQECYRELIQ